MKLEQFGEALFSSFILHPSSFDLMGSRRKARECALQMLFAADVSGTCGDELARGFWSELADGEMEPDAREFATRLALGTLANLEEVDERIRSRAEHWR